MDHTGHRERLRQRFDQNGLNGFADHEVLELLLTYAIPRMDVNPLAHRLMDAFGSLGGVLEASVHELKQVHGMGERSAALLCMLLPLLKRYQQGTMGKNPRFTTFSALAAHCASLFIGQHEESFYLLCFDTKMHLTKEILLGTGTASEVSVSPKMVVREAMRANAVAAAVSHNHPSGDSSPSAADVELTEGIRDALSLVEIRFLDHVIVGRQDAFSMVRNGLVDIPLTIENYAAAEKDTGRAERMIRRCREDEDLLL